MPNPLPFDSASPRYELPSLFAGQAQKEAWVNEAHARIDAIMHCAVEGTRADPPSSPAEGEAWIVAAGASGTWAGQDGAIASRQGANWLFITPRDGLRIFDRSTGQERLWSVGWKYPAPPLEPSGGTVVDVEARTAVSQLIAALRVSGVFPID